MRVDWEAVRVFFPVTAITKVCRINADPLVLKFLPSSSAFDLHVAVLGDDFMSVPGYTEDHLVDSLIRTYIAGKGMICIIKPTDSGQVMLLLIW